MLWRMWNSVSEYQVVLVDFLKKNLFIEDMKLDQGNGSKTTKNEINCLLWWEISRRRPPQTAGCGWIQRIFQSRRQSSSVILITQHIRGHGGGNGRHFLVYDLICDLVTNAGNLSTRYTQFSFPFHYIVGISAGVYGRVDAILVLSLLQVDFANTIR